MRKTLLLFCLLTFSCVTAYAEGEKQQAKKELAIVIDDFGNNMKGTEEMLNLPVPITAAIMPFMPTSKEDAIKAHKKGHDVIIHMPLEPKQGKKSWLGPGAITTNLSDEEIRKRVVSAIESIPYAVGMNHHMGSKATEDERVMRIILEECKKHDLFYLDSKTTGKSVVKKLAEELQVPYLENNMFFDHIYSNQHIQKQATSLVKNLNKKDEYIAIGHVGISGPAVVSVLKQYIPLYQKDAEIVPLSTLVDGYELLDTDLP
ncbi:MULTISPECIES: divergent polysaccharide deacetylase family protein [Bacillaceae]|uniref:divergent polysaccharide deacetylase family protein n=1 Tax=Bacillaceae TaxID=186817 RepID=UPI001E32AEBC|nr:MULTISPECIES: divergent polysaccharide deacetylase family protein [Bacillaceae]MCE4050665.1 divergent polysaccharide deacetylase family protein [Bacillus sp. Au-Bac7]MCM3031935.1 divergent polysaccharide deacetylase family protein [Niallia sp. MER 6]MDL0436060.1 divergent polysaccharide deacetylase family protein [Niallia sp. SS-2023]UPO87919.1 divergent polysaccharide deacetylase family protein [Niallia sp. Man26]